jgi:flagellar biosynthetic protein FliP
MRNWLRRFLMIAFPLYLAVTSSELAAQLPEEGTATANRPMAIAVSDQREDPVADSDKSEANTGVNSSSLTDLIAAEAKQLVSRENSGTSIKALILLGALSLAPALVLMTTCYVRVIVVLSLLRQAFGGQQLPPTQVLTALSLFITLLVMMPVWNEVKHEAIDPYSDSQSISWEEAWSRGLLPVKKFMAKQIEVADNKESIALFYKYLPRDSESSRPTSLEQVPISVLLPAFLVSELKVAFLLGFQIYLPFLVLDLVVSTVTVSMGMLMLPPTMVSFPLKLILFVMVDGWNLVVGMLLQSFGPFS